MRETKEKSKIATMENNPNALMQLAVKNNASIEHLEKLMNLQERWEKNQARKAFYDAKSEFQSKKPTIKKTSKVGYTSRNSNTKTQYSFAPLSEIQKQVDPILAELGFSYDYKQTDEKGSITITCVLSHRLGHSETSSLTAPHDNSGGKNAIQSIGSTVSYLKRYTLTNIIGLSTEDDDDGASTMTAAEAKELRLRLQLVELYAAKKENLSEDIINRVDEILAANLSDKYARVITRLKQA